MDTATVRVTRVGPLVSLQDGGRRGWARYGVPASGPMDPLAHAAANVAAGNAGGATAIEVSLGGLTLECASGSLAIAVAGGGFRINNEATPSWRVLTLEEGEALSVDAGDWGSWAYVAFAGELESKRWLGSTATHTMSGKGGGVVEVGDEFRVTECRHEHAGVRELAIPSFARPGDVARVVMGPQLEMFGDNASETLLGGEFRLTADYDRMGVRLAGPPLRLGDVLSVPSEPVVRGAIQVAGDGVATVLLADHQTTGGYPKIATVISADLARLCQGRSGDPLRFVAVSPQRAVSAARESAEARNAFLDGIANRSDPIAEQLRTQNLISWGEDLADDSV